MGLTTLDLIYHAPLAPSPNEKIVAESMTFAAGGPATNAAIAFAALGGEATLLSVVGTHPLSQMIHHDLDLHLISHVDLSPDRAEPPTVSSVVVSTETGDRAVTSKNAQGHQVMRHSALEIKLHSLLETADVILFDGHQMALSQSIAAKARELNIPSVFDGGSWKVGSEILLPDLTHIICSEAYCPPGCGNDSQVFQRLRSLNSYANLAMTRGANPILYETLEKKGTCPCPSVPVLDTLGSGDFFHGAFAFWICQKSFEPSIQAASEIASLSCQYLGTREWIKNI